MAGMKTHRTDIVPGNQRALAMPPSAEGFQWIMKRRPRERSVAHRSGTMRPRSSKDGRMPGDDSSDLAGRLAVTAMRMKQRRKRNLDFYLLAAVAAVCAVLVAVFGFR